MAVAPACGGHRPSSHCGSIPTAKAPHFSRLGDVEVNAGQNASFQCMAAGRAAEAERFLLQVRGCKDLRQGGGGDFFWDLGPLWGAESFLHFPAPIYKHRCAHLGSALPSWVLLYLQDRGWLQDPPTALHRRQRPRSLNQLLIRHLPVTELVPGTPSVPCVLGTAKWGPGHGLLPWPGLERDGGVGTLPLRRS